MMLAVKRLLRGRGRLRATAPNRSRTQKDFCFLAFPKSSAQKKFVFRVGSRCARYKNVATLKAIDSFQRHCSSRRPIRLQVPAKLAIANDSPLLQINGRRIVAVPYRRWANPGRMATPVIVTVRRAAKEMIHVPFADHAKAVEHLVLERLHHPLDVRLQVR